MRLDILQDECLNKLGWNWVIKCKTDDDAKKVLEKQVDSRLCFSKTSEYRYWVLIKDFALVV